MPQELIPFLIIGGAVIFYFFWQEEKKRRLRLVEWAQRNNWHFQRGKRKGLDNDYPAIKLFNKGHSRFGNNIITGHFKAMDVTCMDYQYTTGHGKNRHTHRQGVVILAVDHPLIPLQIRREHVLDKVGEFLGADDIDFESAEFSRKFYVKSADKKWAYDVIHSRTMEYLLQSPNYFAIEFGHNEILVFKSGRCEPDQYEKAVTLARDLYDLIPGFAREQMRGK